MIIYSKPREHRALLENEAEIGPFQTEIELVEALLEKGINLSEWRCFDTHGYDFICVSSWVKRVAS